MSNNINYNDYNARFNGNYTSIWQNTGKCVFCDLKEKYIIQEQNGVVLTVALFPYINGHLLIIPRRHIECYSDMNQKEWKSMQELLNIGIKLLRDSEVEFKDYWFMYRIPDGFKAGKTVNHTHGHILPYNDDLHKFNYQNITYPPIVLAENLRKLL
jgi:diadenosine tetraphosphate (Ap4A) HIT family hydrolase